MGSTRVVVDSLGTIVQQADYLPYGEKCRNSTLISGENDYLYGGKEFQAPLFNIPWYDSQARFQTTDGMFVSLDPLCEKYYSLSPYAYCAGNPVRYVDRDGGVVETALDIVSLGLGVKSFVSNVKAGNTRGAIWDGVGIVADAAAVVLPLVPGGVGVALKAARAAERGTDIVKAADNAGDAVRTLDKAGGIVRSVDPTKNRVKLRKNVVEKIKDNAHKTLQGDYIDPNTQKVIPKEGPYDIGHVKGESWQKRKIQHQEAGHTRKEVIESENNPDLYQIEDPSSNRSRRYD